MRNKRAKAIKGYMQSQKNKIIADLLQAKTGRF